MIEYKLVKIDMTGNVYPQQVCSQSFTTDDLKERLKQRFGVMSSAVIDEAFHILSQQIGEGNTVSIKDFGTFTLRLGMTKPDVKEFEDVRSQDIQVKGIRFKPAKELRHCLSNQSIHLLDGEKVRRKLTTEDRWVLLYNYVLKEQSDRALPIDNITIAVSTYQRLTGCTYHTARKELALFCQEGKLRELFASRNKLYVVNALYKCEE